MIVVELESRIVSSQGLRAMLPLACVYQPWIRHQCERGDLLATIVKILEPHAAFQSSVYTIVDGWCLVRTF